MQGGSPSAGWCGRQAPASNSSIRLSRALFINTARGHVDRLGLVFMRVVLSTCPHKVFHFIGSRETNTVPRGIGLVKSSPARTSDSSARLNPSAVE